MVENGLGSKLIAVYLYFAIRRQSPRPFLRQLYIYINTNLHTIKLLGKIIEKCVRGNTRIYCVTDCV